MKFSSKRTRLILNKGQIREKNKEHIKELEKITFDRNFAIDAAIVRIMKSRKELSHQLLLSEVFQQLTFSTKAMVIKKRIENLIERDYIERKTDDNSIYLYVA